MSRLCFVRKFNDARIVLMACTIVDIRTFNRIAFVGEWEDAKRLS
jgi:hypothetical protein